MTSLWLWAIDWRPILFFITAGDKLQIDRFILWLQVFFKFYFVFSCLEIEWSIHKTYRVVKSNKSRYFNESTFMNTWILIPVIREELFKTYANSYSESYSTNVKPRLNYWLTLTDNSAKMSMVRFRSGSFLTYCYLGYVQMCEFQTQLSIDTIGVQVNSDLWQMKEVSPVVNQHNCQIKMAALVLVSSLCSCD